MRRRYLMAGTVQGVGFRYFTRRVAQRLGLAGWVRNLPDGRVEAEAQGNVNSLDAFEAELRRGPPGALVTQFEPAEISDETDHTSGFVIQ